jgi:hypothetical protein
MTHTPYDTQENVVVKTPVTRGPSITMALTIAIVSAVIAVVATVAVIRNDYSLIVEASLAAISLIAFGVTAYGLIQAVLALVDSAGERRRQDREISERRKGDRARKPKAG